MDGQVLVIHDMLGINKGFSPRFLRRYADLHEVMTGAVTSYVEDVKSGDFPNESEQYLEIRVFISSFMCIGSSPAELSDIFFVMSCSMLEGNRLSCRMDGARPYCGFHRCMYGDMSAAG